MPCKSQIGTICLLEPSRYRLSACSEILRTESPLDLPPRLEPTKRRTRELSITAWDRSDVTQGASSTSLPRNCWNSWPKRDGLDESGSFVRTSAQPFTSTVACVERRQAKVDQVQGDSAGRQQVASGRSPCRQRHRRACRQAPACRLGLGQSVRQRTGTARPARARDQ